MKVIINSKEKNLDEGKTVADLAKELNVAGAGTAIAINGAVISRPLWETTALHDGDDILIISAAYGG